MSELCTVLPVAYARAHAWAEYDGKNMDHTGGARAVGVDIGASLPGLYWSNFFGKLYVDLIGLNRLLSAPAYEVRKLGNGVILMLSASPWHWTTREYAEAERQVLQHLGEHYFFSKQNPDRETVGPDLRVFSV